MGEQVAVEAVNGLSGTPILLAAVIVVLGSLGALIWTVRAFLLHIRERNGRTEAVLQSISEQQAQSVICQAQIAERLKGIDHEEIAVRLARLEGAVRRVPVTTGSVLSGGGAG